MKIKFLIKKEHYQYLINQYGSKYLYPVINKLIEVQNNQNFHNIYFKYFEEFKKQSFVVDGILKQDSSRYEATIDEGLVDKVKALLLTEQIKPKNISFLIHIYCSEQYG